jgi:uncharacterized protein (TIGR04222 family)
MLVEGSDTWGISGATFLWMYGSLCVLCFAAVWLSRRRLLRSPSVTARQELGEYELAVLNGGSELAATAAAAKLQAAGAVKAGSRRGTLQVSGTLQVGANELEREAFDAVSRVPEISMGELRNQIAAGRAARGLIDRLIRIGLLVDPRRARVLRRLTLPGLALLALGIARIVAGVANYKPTGYLIGLVIAVAVLNAILAFMGRRMTTAGRDILRERRSQHENWRAAPADIAPGLAVALFGGGALWTIDPACATALCVARESGSGGTYAGVFVSGGGGGCGGGGGGGGGGCGG